jgi:MoaA/NifB/PqqE/SkfB family radical SAM enzyme
MCYFSDDEYISSIKGKLKKDEIDQIIKIFFSKAFQLVLGCGAEPTIYKDYKNILLKAKEYKIPNISIVTNGMLLEKEDLDFFSDINLNELILSFHGATKEVYEEFMVNAKFDKIISVLDNLSELDKVKNIPSVRINYTVNDRNLSDLSNISIILKKYPIKVLQLRPVRNIGGQYSDSIKDHQIKEYNATLDLLSKVCNEEKIMFLANKIDVKYEKENHNSQLIQSVYTYIGPNTAKSLNISWDSTNLKKYKKSLNWKNRLVERILGKKTKNPSSDDFLKYEIID